MCKIVLIFLLSGSVEQPNEWTKAIVNSCPQWLRKELYSAAVDIGLVWDIRCGGYENYWANTELVIWILDIKARYNSSPLKDDLMYGEWMMLHRRRIGVEIIPKIMKP